MRLQESGIAVISSTTLDGKSALRVAITNHRSRREDFEILIEAVASIGSDVQKARGRKDFHATAGAADA